MYRLKNNKNFDKYILLHKTYDNKIGNLSDIPQKLIWETQ